MKLIKLLFLFLVTGSHLSAQTTDTSFKVRNVALLIYEDVELLDFAGPGEVLQQAGVGDKKAFNIYTVSSGKKEITSQHFVKVTAQYTLDDCPMPDILVIPGGDSFTQATNEKLIAWINKVNQNAEYMLTVCNGVRLLAKTGALDGKTATSHYMAVDNLRKEFPNVTIISGKRFVDNGRIITTEGVSAGIDGSLYLVSKLFNKELAEAVAKKMMYHWKPEELSVLIK